MRFRDSVDVNSLGRVEGVSILSQDSDSIVTFQVDGEVNGLIKALAAFPVIDLDIERPSLEEIFLAYYEAGKKESN